MANQLVTLENVGGVLEEIERAFFDIPFENSDFQTKAFVVAAQQTPARAYRAIGLRMFSKIQAVKEYQFSKQMSEIDIDEKEAKLADESTNEFDKRRLRLEITKAKDSAGWSAKLANDALHDLNLMYAELQKYPAFTREQFEAEEPVHFNARLHRQVVLASKHGAGALEAQLNMGPDMTELEGLIKAVAMPGIAHK